MIVLTFTRPSNGIRKSMKEVINEDGIPLDHGKVRVRNHGGGNCEVRIEDSNIPSQALDALAGALTNKYPEMEHIMTEER